jgi:glycosyltransferase involved in cell wall biosynthesis
MWSFSGRCAYSYDCQKFLTGCDATCPTPDEYPALAPSLIAVAWQARRRLLGKHPSLVAVCPSRWLARNARAGLWKDHLVEVIPYGVPLETYLPLDRAKARGELGVPAGGAVVSFVANLLSERRKGAEILAQALTVVKSRPLTVLVLGRGELKIAADGVKVCALGFVEDERRRAVAYSAADVMVHPAPVDNLPNVVMEAIACGTPCVAFAIGGVPDMVRPELTGWLVDEVTPEALGAAIDDAIDDVQKGGSLRASCRDIAEREYGDRLQARRYLRVFESLDGGSTHRDQRRTDGDRS